MAEAKLLASNSNYCVRVHTAFVTPWLTIAATPFKNLILYMINSMTYRGVTTSEPTAPFRTLIAYHDSRQLFGPVSVRALRFVVVHSLIFLGTIEYLKHAPDTWETPPRRLDMIMTRPGY